VTGDGVRLSKVVNCARSCGEGCDGDIDMDRVKGEWVLIWVKLELKCGGKSKGKLTDPDEPVCCERRVAYICPTDSLPYCAGIEEPSAELCACNGSLKIRLGGGPGSI